MLNGHLLYGSTPPDSIFQGEVDDDHDVDGVDRTHQHRVVKVRGCQVRVDFRLKKKKSNRNLWQQKRPVTNKTIHTLTNH